MKIGIWSLESVSGSRFTAISPVPGDADKVYARIRRAFRKNYPDERASTFCWDTKAWTTIKLRSVAVTKGGDTK
jgi:hypothetical protein